MLLISLQANAQYETLLANACKARQILLLLLVILAHVRVLCCDSEVNEVSPSLDDKCSSQQLYLNWYSCLTCLTIFCSRSVADTDSFYSYTYNNDKALFRCNLCGDKFTQNSNLLVHLKTNHMAVSRALKAQFSCAKCPAKFFKNDFLLKHSLIHSAR